MEAFALIYSIKDVFDILLVAFLIYLILLLLKRTHSTFILGGIMILFIVYTGAIYFQFHLTKLLFQYFFTFLIFIIIVIFQRELRNFFEWIFVLGLSRRTRAPSASESTTIEILETLYYLASRKIGALIVIAGEQPLERFLTEGYALNGQISSPLLLSIFDPSSPGHDGAIVVAGDQVKKFGVHLPLAERFDGYKHLGTRHRSALGLSQRTDALVLVVSEERGTISLAQNGKLEVATDRDVLKDSIQNFLTERPSKEKKWHRWITENLHLKIFALATAILLWFTIVFNK